MPADKTRKTRSSLSEPFTSVRTRGHSSDVRPS